MQLMEENSWARQMAAYFDRDEITPEKAKEFLQVLIPTSSLSKFLLKNLI